MKDFIPIFKEEKQVYKIVYKINFTVFGDNFKCEFQHGFSKVNFLKSYHVYKSIKYILWPN